MMRVFFDASVLVAALLSPEGGSAKLLQFVKKGLVVGSASQTVIEEIIEEDKTAKLGKTRSGIEKFVAASGLMISERINPEEIAPYTGKIDSEDAHLLAGAMLTKCDCLVSLDKKHVLCEENRQQFPGLQIVSPAELIAEIVTRFDDEGK